MPWVRCCGFAKNGQARDDPSMHTYTRRLWQQAHTTEQYSRQQAHTTEQYTPSNPIAGELGASIASNFANLAPRELKLLMMIY